MLLWLAVDVTTVFSREFLIGEVLTVNHETMEIEIQSQGLPENKASEIQSEMLSVEVQSNIPACATVGATIRLWGRYQKGTSSNRFLASEIRGCREGGCSDPTGVRSRLSQRGNHRHKNRENDQPTGEYGEKGGKHGLNTNGGGRDGNSSGNGNGEGGGGGGGGGGGK